MIFYVSKSRDGRSVGARADRPSDARILKYYTPIEADTVADAVAIFMGTELTPRKPVKAPKLPAYGTIAVRFIYGHNLEKKYTYRVREKGLAKLYLGQEIVVPVPEGPRIAVVVEIHATPQDTTPGIDYMFATGTIAAF